MEISIRKTDRGFVRGEFIDRYGSSCSIQESSLLGENAIWLGCVDNRMHLTQEMVSALLPLLQLFVETGGLSNEEATAD